MVFLFLWNFLPSGSVPLGFYRPIKATIDKLFQLGITPAPNLAMSSVTSSDAAVVSKAMNGGLTNGNGTTTGAADGNNSNCQQNGDFRAEISNDEPQQDDDLNVVYSEGTQKTDLLY